MYIIASKFCSIIRLTSFMEANHICLFLFSMILNIQHILTKNKRTFKILQIFVLYYKIEKNTGFPMSFYSTNLYFFSNVIFPNTVPTICTILVEFLCAIPFPIAFPPTVKDATIALIINCKSNVKPNFSVIFIVIKAAIEPLSTPANISYYISTNICYFC